MNNILRTAIASLALASLVSVNDAQAQRTVGARSVVLTDGTSNTLTLIAPSPATWVGNLDWEVPVPPVSGANSGFTYGGSALDDLLAWLPAGQTYGPYSGGTSGAWVPKTSTALGFISAGTAAGGDLTGTYPNPSIAPGAIVDADVNAAAAIAYSKLNLTGSIMNADVNASAAIAYSKLNLANSIVSGDIFDGTLTNADINAAAGIAYSKLNLAGSIMNADVNASAAIAYSKLNLANSIVSGDIFDGTLTNADINAAAGIAYSKLNLAGSIMNADVNASAAIAYSKLNLANSIVSGDIFDGTLTNADINAAAGIAYSKLNLAGSIMNADVNASAAIAYSKLNLAGSLVGTDFAAGTLTLTNTNVSLGNNDNAARELRLLEPSGSGVNFTALKAAAQASDLTLTLPGSTPAVGEFLQVTAVGAGTATLDWSGVGGGAIALARVGVTSGVHAVAASTDIVGADPSAGTITLNFPSAATAGAGHLIIVKDEGFASGTNNITVNAAGGESVEDQGCGCLQASTVLNFDGDAVRFYSDGVDSWYRW